MKWDAGRLQQCAGIDQIGESFFLDKAPHRQNAGHRAGSMSLRRWGEKLGVKAVIDRVNVLAARKTLRQMRRVSAGACGDKARGAQLAGEQITRILIGLINVLGMGGKAKRNTRQPTDEPGNGGGAVAKVTMQVANRRCIDDLHGDVAGL